MALPASTASTALGVDVTRALELVGFEFEAIDGEIGKVDEATHEVGSSYVIVDTSPWLFGKRVIPAGVIRRGELGSQRIHVDRAKQEIKTRPRSMRLCTATRNTARGCGPITTEKGTRQPYSASERGGRCSLSLVFNAKGAGSPVGRGSGLRKGAAASVPG